MIIIFFCYAKTTIWRTEEMLFNDKPIPRSTPHNYPTLIIP